MGQFSDIIMSIIAIFHKAHGLLEEIGTKLGWCEWNLQEPFIDVIAIESLEYKKWYSNSQTSTDLAFILDKAGVKVFTDELDGNF